MQSTPETYPIADFLKWHRERELILNPDFQRGSVWRDSAKSYLIDTILRGMPVPKILFRTKIDRQTKQIVREVVDGQQRLRAILAFADNKLTLGSRSREFAGLTYDGLEPDDQDRFLAYKLTTEQLVNASNEDVLEIFVRINSYTVPVNPPELRHAKYDTDFKWSIVETKKKIANFWSLGTLSERERVRMLDASLVAEMYGLLINGVTDGGQPKINALYEQFKDSFPQQAVVEKRTLAVIGVLEELLAELQGESIVGPPHVLMLFAAVAHSMYGIPRGSLSEDAFVQAGAALRDVGVARDNVKALNDLLAADAPPRGWAGFWTASKSTTQRIASRRVRFPVYVQALQPQPLAP